MDIKIVKKIIKKKLPWLFNKNRDIFTNIYENNLWNSSESFSGEGSTLIQTEVLRKQLPLLFEEYQIKTILDIPCGDYNWMKEVDKSNLKYIGADIVKPLIRSNRKKFKAKNVSFKVLDLINDKLPQVDLIFVRDCFVHLSLNEISKAIKNIKKSNSKYLLTTTFVERNNNEDSSLGGWRPLNLQITPFNFPKPLLIINEECTEGNGSYKDKSMALWLIDELN